jgi:hypothetical protein
MFVRRHVMRRDPLQFIRPPRTAAGFFAGDLLKPARSRPQHSLEVARR